MIHYNVKRIDVLESKSLKTDVKNVNPNHSTLSTYQNMEYQILLFEK
jgi:hypothetical protein